MTEDTINRHASELAEQIAIYEDIESSERLRILIRIQMRSLLGDVSGRSEFNGDTK